MGHVTVVLILMLRMPFTGEIVSNRVEMADLPSCWKAAADFVKQDMSDLKPTMVGAACEIHRANRRDS